MKKYVTCYQYRSGYMHNAFSSLVWHPACKFKNHSIHKISGMQLSLELQKHLKMDGSWPDWQKHKSCQCGTEL